jgi:hypothetical protein
MTSWRKARSLGTLTVALFALAPLAPCFCASPAAAVSHHCCPAGPALTAPDSACCRSLVVTPAASATVVLPVTSITPATLVAVVVQAVRPPVPFAFALPPPPSVLRI